MKRHVTSSFWSFLSSCKAPVTCRRRSARGRANPALETAARAAVESLEGRRLLSAGQLDPTFGDDGKVATDLDGGGRSQDVAVRATQADGKVVVVGTATRVGGTDLAVVRYTADGHLDATFGSGGKLSIPFAQGLEVHDVAVQADGKVLVAGALDNTATGAGWDMAVVRLTAAGALDVTYDGDGVAEVDFGSKWQGRTDRAYAVTLQADGRAVVAGSTENWADATGSDFAVARLNADGSLDTTFGGGGAGRTSVDFGAPGDFHYDQATAVAVDDAGRVVVLGVTPNYYTGTGYDFGVARLNADGSTDTSFGDSDPGADAARSGRTTVDFGGYDRNSYDAPVGLVALPGGKVVVAGETTDYAGGTGVHAAAARLNADGSLDGGFGSGGVAVVDYRDSYGYDHTVGVAVRADGGIILAGTSGEVWAPTATDFAVVALTPDGALDPSFGGGNGRATIDSGHPTGDNSETAAGLLLTADGRIVVAGMAGGGFALARMTADGSPDTTFGTDGWADPVDFSAPHGPSVDAATRQAVQPDGKIVVVGSVFDRDNAIGVARYNPDGTLDATFGTGGRVLLRVRRYLDPAGVAVQADGKIVVAGSTGNASTIGIPGDFAVFRLTPDGALDTGFGGGDGLVTVDFGATADESRNDVAVGVALADGGKILVGGYTDDYAGGTGRDFAAARLNADGSLDATFGDGGRATIDLGDPGQYHYDVATGMTLDRDGRLVVVGYTDGSAAGTGYDFGVARFDVDGTPDSTFGDGAGRLTVDFGAPGQYHYDLATGVAVDAEGRVVVGGYTENYAAGTAYDLAVARLDGSGALDATFGAGGRATADFGGPDAFQSELAYGVAVQANGKVLLAGVTTGNGNDFAVARLNADGGIDIDFSDGGLARIDFGVPDSYDGHDEIASNVVVEADGQILVAGYTDDSAAGLGRDFAIVRLQGDPTNRPPTAADDALAGSEDTALFIDPATLLANDSDPDAGQTLQVTGVTATPDTHGAVAFDPETAQITYTPEANYHGPASFAYTIDDGHGGTATATVTVSIAAVNDAPTAADGAYHVAEDGSVLVDLRQLAADVETPAGDLVYTIVSQPARGQLAPVAGQNGVFRYTPGAGTDAALDSFAFTVTDAGDGTYAAKTSGPATVSLAIDRYAGASRDAAGLLRIGLTDASDAVVVSNGVLYVNGSAVSLDGVTEVRVWARGGNDLVSLDGLTVPAQVFAGAGNDVVVGGSAGDLLLGEAGDDWVTGGDGDDLLLGGDGEDHLYGLGGNDVLGADDFGPAATLAQLRQLQSLWADRQITAGDAQAADAVFDTDGDADVLSGGNGADWFILGTADRITDLSRAAGNAPNSGDQVTYV